MYREKVRNTGWRCARTAWGGRRGRCSTTVPSPPDALARKVVATTEGGDELSPSAGHHTCVQILRPILTIPIVGRALIHWCSIGVHARLVADIADVRAESSSPCVPIDARPDLPRVLVIVGGWTAATRSFIIIAGTTGKATEG